MAAPAPPESPLPPCPATPNCHRASRAYDLVPQALFDAALAAVRDLGGLTIGRATEIERDGLGLRAPFRVFVFTDDLDLRVTPHGGGSVLHVRSASRVGHGDLGTNRRRVRALLDAVAPGSAEA
jgi:uncharacterized protein (DUF1499 family)